MFRNFTKNQYRNYALKLVVGVIFAVIGLYLAINIYPFPAIYNNYKLYKFKTSLLNSDALEYISAKNTYTLIDNPYKRSGTIDACNQSVVIYFDSVLDSKGFASEVKKIEDSSFIDFPYSIGFNKLTAETGPYATYQIYSISDNSLYYIEEDREYKLESIENEYYYIEAGDAGVHLYILSLEQHDQILENSSIAKDEYQYVVIFSDMTSDGYPVRDIRCWNF